MSAPVYYVCHAGVCDGMQKYESQKNCIYCGSAISAWDISSQMRESVQKQYQQKLNLTTETRAEVMF